MDSLYGNSIVTLSSDDKKRFNRVSKAFNDTAEWLHRKKAFTPEMLSEPEPLALISATHDVLAEELGRLERRIPDEMARALDENIFLFSGFKTYHELNDASRLLKDDDGGFKSFDRFLQDVKAIDAQYNQNYLYAEYNFATASTQMAAKWADIERDGDEYDLQYRTAMDGLVRPEHAALEGVTLPPSDKFWNEYYPPNGWNCRCTAVQVLHDKYPLSDSDKACEAGERATTQIGKNGENKAAMFRFNPGKEGKVFPPKHPYLPKGCGDCSFNKLAYNANSEKCRTCKELWKVIRSVQDQTIASDKAKTVTAIKSIKKTIPPYDGIVTSGKNFESGKMTMLRRSFDDVYEHAIENEDVRKWLQSFSFESLKEMKYKGWGYCHPYPKDHPKYDPANPLKSKHDNDTDYFLYYTIKIDKRNYWVNVKMHKNFGEVIYTVEKVRPNDLIKGHKKSETENVYSSRKGLGANYIRITVAKIQNF